MSQVKLTRAKLETLTKKLARQRRIALRNKPGTRERHRARTGIHKLKGRISTLNLLLAKLLQRQNEGGKAAVRWARAQVGTTERPAYSNLGPGITDWERNTGYKVPPGVFWCGCFASEAVVAHGKANVPNRSRCGYGPYVMADAKAGRNGFTQVNFDAIQPGDYLVFFGGEHQGIAAARPSGGTVRTVEGNTSPTSSGSQFNGGCVAAKTRTRADVSCAVRPAYPKES